MTENQSRLRMRRYLRHLQYYPKNTGLFAEPAAATAFAGLLSFQRNGKIAGNSDNVVLLTGSGLKDLKSVRQNAENS